METNIQKNNNSKTISPLRVLFLLHKLKARVRNVDKNAVAIAIRFALETAVQPSEIFKLIKDSSVDNFQGVIDSIGEDLFNDINAIRELPTYSWYDLSSRRSGTVILAGGRRTDHTYLYWTRKNADK